MGFRPQQYEYISQFFESSILIFARFELRLQWLQSEVAFSAKVHMLQQHQQQGLMLRLLLKHHTDGEGDTNSHCRRV
jgi:hypothetical protein